LVSAFKLEIDKLLPSVAFDLDLRPYIKVWNYARTPARGAAEVAVLLDDVYVYQGTLRQAPSLGEPTTAGTDGQCSPRHRTP